LTCLCWDGRTALIGGGSGNLTLFDLHNGEEKLKIPAHSGPITSLFVSQDGDYVASGGEDRRVIVWTTKTEEN
jgi:WD40 repeat protein